MMIRILLLVSYICICSCSSHFATDGEHQYLNSKNGTNIVVPEHLSSENTNHFYDLPAQNKKNPEVSIASPYSEPEKQTT